MVMAEKKKLKVQKVAELEQKTCSNCSNFLIIEGMTGFCKKREGVFYGSYYCPMHEKGEPAEVDLVSLVVQYVIFKEELEQIQRQLDILRDAIIRRVKGEADVGTYVVKVQEVTVNRLNTKKVRDYLKRMGILDEFLVQSKHYRVEVKKKLS